MHKLYGLLLWYLEDKLLWNYIHDDKNNILKWTVNRTFWRKHIKRSWTHSYTGKHMPKHKRMCCWHTCIILVPVPYLQRSPEVLNVTFKLAEAGHTQGNIQPYKTERHKTAHQCRALREGSDILLRGWNTVWQNERLSDRVWRQTGVEEERQRCRNRDEDEIEEALRSFSAELWEIYTVLIALLFTVLKQG